MMIQAQELRIGNFLVRTEALEFYPVAVKNIHDACINMEVISSEPDGNYPDDNGSERIEKIDLSGLSGIMLTPEILEKCGFKPIADGHLIFQLVNGRFWFEAWPRHDGRYHIDAAVEEDGGTPPICATDITSLHHFQNVYYFTTGQELEVKL